MLHESTYPGWVERDEGTGDSWCSAAAGGKWHSCCDKCIPTARETGAAACEHDDREYIICRRLLVKVCLTDGVRLRFGCSCQSCFGSPGFVACCFRSKSGYACLLSCGLSAGSKFDPYYILLTWTEEEIASSEVGSEDIPRSRFKRICCSPATTQHPIRPRHLEGNLHFHFLPPSQRDTDFVGTLHAGSSHLETPANNCSPAVVGRTKEVRRRMVIHGTGDAGPSAQRSHRVQLNMAGKGYMRYSTPRECFLECKRSMEYAVAGGLPDWLEGNRHLTTCCRQKYHHGQHP